MSDYFQSYVFGEALADDGRADLKRVTAWLLAEEIIGAETADNTLEGEGYVPGPRAASILKEDNGHWRELGTKGARIATGRIIEFSHDLEAGRCPRCGGEVVLGTDAFEVIDDALSAYNDGRSDTVECPFCRTFAKLSTWDFGRGLAVGQAMAKFWNWPQHVDGLAARLSDISGFGCRFVWGRV